jgi:hypothetical protein
MYLNADVVLFVGMYFLVHATDPVLFLDLLFVLVSWILSLIQEI